MSATILLADDSLTIQKVVELTFADTDHHVVCTSSGDDLLQRLGSIAPDIVICDVIMPGTDGYQVCQQIKNDAATAHIPVVLLTGTFEPFDRDRAVAAGCDEIITKPFEARRLVEAVERLLTDRPTGAAAASQDFEGAVRPAPPAPEPWSDDDTAATLPDEGLPLHFEGSAPAPAPGVEAFQTGQEEDLPREEAPEWGEAPPPVAGSRWSEPEPAPSADVAEPWAAATDAAAEPGAPDWDQPAGEMDIATTEWEETPSAPAPAAWQEAAADGPAPSVADEPAPAAPMEEPPFEEPERATVDDAAAWDAPSARLLDPDDAAGDEAVTAAEAANLHEESAAEVDTDEPAGTPPAAAAVSGALSDDDVERIARRVLELAAERIEQIAWEVIPDMAELVVRERIRQLEAQVEAADEGGLPA